MNPENAGRLQKGHIISRPVQTKDGMQVDLVITDAALIADAESGRKRGVSLNISTFQHRDTEE